MANKGFGARELTLLSGGTPTISVPAKLDINATEVGISTGLTVGAATTLSSTLDVSGTATFSGRINASELNAEVYFQESDDSDKTCNIPFMTADQSGNTFAWLEVDNDVLTFNPGTNYLRTTNLTVSNDIDVSGSYSGDGSGLSNIVTSLVAGSGITINNSTGAITITNSSQGVGANDSLNTTGIITASAFDSNGTGDPVIRVGSGTTLNLEAPIVAISTNLTVGGTATLDTLEATVPNLPTIYAGAGSTITLAANNVAISTNCSVGGDLTVSSNIGLVGNINGTDGTININSNVLNFFNGAGSTKFLEINHTTGTVAVSTTLSASKLSLADATGNTGDNSLALGDSDDAKIYYQSNAANGTLQIQCDKIFLRAKTGLESPIISGEYNAEVKLWYAGTPKLETTPAGVKVSGIATASSFKTNSTTGNGSDNGYGITYDITANGSSSYRFAGPGIVNTIDNPTIYLHRGFTYHLVNTTGGHPFRIQYAGTTTGYGSTYLSGSQTGTQVFTVPFDAPGTLEYECTSHSSMVGTIVIPVS